MAKCSAREKILRGNAGQFRVASELCRRGYSACITLGNTPNTDILCASKNGLRSICIQVKTFRLGASKCPISKTAEEISQKDFIWVFLGLDDKIESEERPAEFYIVPASILSRQVAKSHQTWLHTVGRNGRKHKDNPLRNVSINRDIPPTYNIKRWKDKWDVIASAFDA